MRIEWVTVLSLQEMVGSTEEEEALQLTGKSNYKAFSDYLKNPLIMEQPDLVATRICV